MIFLCLDFEVVNYNISNSIHFLSRDKILRKIGSTMVVKGLNLKSFDCQFVIFFNVLQILENYQIKQTEPKCIYYLYFTAI